MTSMAHATAATPLCLVVGMLSLASPAQAQSPLFEVEKSDATKLLQVTDDAGFLVRGTLGSGTIPAAGPGVRLMWYPKKAAFRAGSVNGPHWDDENIGGGSVGLGGSTRAKGDYSVALGNGVLADGISSIAGGSGSIAGAPASIALGQNAEASELAAVALGDQTSASGRASFAAGFRTKATGQYSTALGNEAQAGGPQALAAGSNTQANGSASTALGSQTVAAGTGSVALGSAVTAQGDGSFAFGDRSIGFPVTAGPGEFLVRAFGGIGLNTGVNIGCDLPANTGAWACTSSRLAKEAFEEIDGEEVLTKLSSMPIQRWRYLGSAAEHVGPFAEDFHAAFGLGESPTKITTVDAEGIALRAVQALERRTAELQAETADLRAANAALQADNTAIRSELAAMRERSPAVAGRKSPITTTTLITTTNAGGR